ncbi:MAG: HEAT repeat domain-containing protein [Bacteroidetes bacterium]|nr:MAG: HEAT repeat domain-containing protein [Bacteroidota bacterium]
MMRSSSCKHDKKDLILHFYGELDGVESAKIDARLQECFACEEYYTGLVSLETAVPRSPSVEPDETVMAAIRQATGRRLREIAGQRSRRLEPRRAISSVPIWARVSVVTVAVVLVFVGGRFSGGGTAAPSSDPSNLVIADISDIVFDNMTGQIRVDYRTLGVNSVSGSLADEKIRMLLNYALTNADNPATRLRAMKMLDMLDPDVVEPDPQLVTALGGIIRDDPNNGMKLRAITALRKIFSGTELDKDLSDLLMKILDTSPNSALRIEALRVLTESELARQDLIRVLVRAARDENSAIRFQARTAIDELDGTIPLERLN